MAKRKFTKSSKDYAKEAIRNNNMVEERKHLEEYLLDNSYQPNDLYGMTDDELFDYVSQIPGISHIWCSYYILVNS